MLHSLSWAVIANRLQRNSSNITNMTLNDTINTIAIKFYIELFSSFFKHFT